MKQFRTEIIIIILLWLNVILSLYFNYNFDVFFILGIVGLLVVTITYKKFYEVSLFSLILILFFSTFNIIKFSLFFSLNFGLISVIPFLFLLTLFYKRKNEILDFKDKWFADDVEEIEERKIKKLEFFKTQFENLSEMELNRKLVEQNLTDEAKKAVIELLENKK